MSLLEIFPSHVEGFERILLHNIIQIDKLTICAHGNSNRLLEELIRQNYKDIVNEKLQLCFYINF